MMKQCNKPNAKVTMLSKPRLQGYAKAKSLIKEFIIDNYDYKDLLLFLPDADGKDRSKEFVELEAEASNKGVTLFCCVAVQEVEAWLLAGHLHKLKESWLEIRGDISVKENTFANFLSSFSNPKVAGKGREILMLETLKNYSGLLERCPELKELQNRIKTFLQVVE